MNYPETLRKLIECYKKLPGIGEKSAERMAFAAMNMDIDQINVFSQSLLNVKNKQFKKHLKSLVHIQILKIL